MALYLKKVRALLNTFETSTIEQVLRSKNANADALARLTSSYETDLSWTVLVEILGESSLIEPETTDIDEPDTPNWRDLIKEYLETGKLPEDQVPPKGSKDRVFTTYSGMGCCTKASTHSHCLDA